LAIRIDGFLMWLHFQIDGQPPWLTIDYTPVATEDSGRRRITEYQAQFRKDLATLPAALQSKLQRLVDYSRSALDLPEVDLGGVTARGTATLVYYQLLRLEQANPSLHVIYRTGGGAHLEADIPISEATMRLIDNIRPTCEQLAWDHLRARLGAPSGAPAEKKKVYLSYRKGVPARRAFVEAIAHRLGREGFNPWFDDWEIVAGDSLPREMGAGLENTYAIITIISADYPGERWAREELESAIVQRVERGIKVIPVLYESCERPSLLQPLSYVDCTSHDPEVFERQFLKIIDALNEIELNPYR